LKGASDEAGSLATKAKEFAEALRPVVRMTREIASSFATAVNWLYKGSQKVAASLIGEYGTISKGEEAKAQIDAGERRAKLNMGKHGITMTDAYDLATFTDLAEQAKAERERATRSMEMQQKWATDPKSGNPRWGERERLEAAQMAEMYRKKTADLSFEENAAWTIYPRACVVRPAMGEAREHAFHPLLGGVESGWVPEA